MIDWNNIFNQSIEEMVIEPAKNIEKSVENLTEQENIIINNRNEYSLEDEESFEDAADEGGGEEDGDFSDDAPPEMDDMEAAMDGEGGGDGGDSGDYSSDDGSSGDDSSGVDKLDLNKGSSLNSFTQINQKLYLIEQLNKLYESINNSIASYNNVYADWSELDQLKELAKIVDEERNSFVMQQNPENIIKLKLYMAQYDTIVRKLSQLIEKKKNS